MSQCLTAAVMCVTVCVCACVQVDGRHLPDVNIGDTCQHKAHTDTSRDAVTSSTLSSSPAADVRYSLYAMSVSDRP